MIAICKPLLQQCVSTVLTPAFGLLLWMGWVGRPHHLDEWFRTAGVLSVWRRVQKTIYSVYAALVTMPVVTTALATMCAEGHLRRARCLGYHALGYHACGSSYTGYSVRRLVRHTDYI